MTIVTRQAKGAPLTHAEGDNNLVELDALILMRVFRDATNPAVTFGDRVFGICLDMHYQAERMTTVNKAPNFFGD